MNRPYPLLVKAEEEVAVRNAARLINDKIRFYKERFSVKEDIDLVIMCCLELATDNLNQATAAAASQEETMAGLKALDEALDSALSAT
jgi:cell division protein ZapA